MLVSSARALQHDASREEAGPQTVPAFDEWFRCMPDLMHRVGVVVIGRNEAAFLSSCLQSLPAMRHVVYVDSASTDDSVAVMRSAGVDVVMLGGTAALSAARAREAGFRRLREVAPTVDLVQFIDGDCTLDPTWLPVAVAALDAEADVAAVWGWRLERRADASVYNRICAIEWRTPPAGYTRHFGGDVLLRAAAYEAAGGYDPAVVASEDHELSARVRARGWRIRRLDAVMTWHDSRMAHFGQWWRRCVRRGVGYAQIWERHHGAPEGKTILRVLMWAAVVPTAALALAPSTCGWSLAALALYPLRVLRVAGRYRKQGSGGFREGLIWGTHVVAASFPYLCGFLHYAAHRLLRRPMNIVEYRLRPDDEPPPVHADSGKAAG